MPKLIDHNTSHQQLIDRAFAQVKLAIECDGCKQDIGYFSHEARYRRNITRILELAAPGATVLDVGSHFLHQAALLSELGFRVLGMDVGEFAGADQIQRRALNFKIDNYVVDRFDRGEFLRGYEDQIDLVVFTEVQEHVTFNPIGFWRRVHQLLRVNGTIYLTTPNSMTVWKIASVLKRLLCLRGYGITVEQILDRVTFGHHWKEYSSYELRMLFETLSPDFAVRITGYEVRAFEQWTNPKAALRDVVRRASGLFPTLREEIETVVTLRQRSQWRVDPPEYF